MNHLNPTLIDLDGNLTTARAVADKALLAAGATPEKQALLIGNELFVDQLFAEVGERSTCYRTLCGITARVLALPSAGRAVSKLSSIFDTAVRPECGALACDIFPTDELARELLAEPSMSQVIEASLPMLIPMWSFWPVSSA